MSKDKGDTAVGYCRPPMKSRFKPGQSGNLRGRRKGSTNFLTDLMRTLRSPVVVHDRGKARKVTTLQAILMRSREKALKGDSREIAAMLGYAQSLSGMANEETSGAMNSVDEAMLKHHREQILQEARSQANADAPPQNSLEDGE